VTTAAEFAAMLAEYAAARTAYNEIDADEGSVEDMAAQERYHQAFRAMLEARPTDLFSMCRQLHWITTEGRGAEIEPAVSHIGEQLEAMAPVEPHVGAVLLSSEAAATIRAVLTLAFVEEPPIAEITEALRLLGVAS
jgi:hypothetical protein